MFTEQFLKLIEPSAIIVCLKTISIRAGCLGSQMSLIILASPSNKESF